MPDSIPQKSSSYDVLILGSGITALSTAYHLSRLSSYKIAVLAPKQLNANSWQSAGMLRGGLSDNFTRLVHHFGHKQAALLWNFGHQAFELLLQFAKEQKITCHQNKRLRLISTQHEYEEARQASKLLEKEQIYCQILKSASLAKCQLSPTKKILAVQDEGPFAADLDLHELKKSLLAQIKADFFDEKALKLEEKPESIVVHLQSTEKIKAKIVVLATHLGTRQLLPELKEALIPVADQFSCYELKDTAQRQPAAAGLALSFNHGYEWLITKENSQICLGGGRYLRPLAGIACEKAVVEERISLHLEKELAASLHNFSKLKRLSSTALLDIYPCDELPLIGPMFGNNKLLLATGYMGQGLSFGFMAGSCLAELIVNGSSASLPRVLWPERLRSLPR